MRRVIIESPYAGNVAEHMRYLQRCIRDCLARGESPYASHQMLTEALNDVEASERDLGISAGFEWRSSADATVVFTDYGISTGMAAGIRHAEAVIERNCVLHGSPCHGIEYRTIGRNRMHEPSGALILERIANAIAVAAYIDALEDADPPQHILDRLGWPR